MQEAGAPKVKEPEKIVSRLGAEAPEFVPFSMMRQPLEVARCSTRPQPGRSTRQQGDDGLRGLSDNEFGYDAVTSITVDGLAPETSPESFMAQLDSWGLSGTYDYFHMPSDEQSQMNAGYALINFVDPAFVLLFYFIYQECQFLGTVAPAEVQGCEANRVHWAQYRASAGPEDSISEPIVIANPTPSQWSVNTVNTMLSPQFRDQCGTQFRKTKLCVFHKKNRCELGVGCPFAHSAEELQPAPDLAKTKLCYNFFRGRCNDARCKFAHGSQELRSVVWVPYSPGVWFFGEDGTCYPALDESLAADGNLGGFSSVDDVLDAVRGAAEDQAHYSAALRRPDKAVADTATGDSVALRVRGTFMEAMRLPDEDDRVLHELSQKRSWSEGDLQAFRDAMEEPDLLGPGLPCHPLGS